MVYVIATSRTWHENLPDVLQSGSSDQFVLINRKEDLTYEHMKDLHPRYIFFPHWSSIIPEEIYSNFECVIFHMTNLPFGRGGSPLQNLIVRGIYDTVISALRCERGIDAGPIYMKKPLSLYGTAEEIFIRASSVIRDMIRTIIKEQPQPVTQSGEVVVFERRKPQDGNIEPLEDLNQIFDCIRMLDADGYPRAFLQTKHFHLEFQRASLKEGRIVSDVIITKKGGEHE